MKTSILLALCSFSLCAQNTNLITIIPKTDLSATGELRFRDKQVTPHYVGFKAPDSISANAVWKLPDSDAVGCLQSDGALGLSFTACGAASVINGFKVTGQSTVAPPSTAVGLQVYHDPSTHISYVKSYSTGSTISGLDITGIANFNQEATFQGSIGLGTTPTITAAFAGAAMQIIGSTTSNGNIILAPGNPAGNGSVVVNTPRPDQPGLILNNVAGTTTANVFEIRDSSSSVVLQVIGSGDAGSPNALTLKGQVSPIGTTPTYTLGNSTHRWLKLWVQDVDISGAISGDFMTLTTSQTATGNKVFTQALTSNIGFVSLNSASNTLNIPNGGVLALNGTFGSISNYIIVQGTAPQINAGSLGSSFNINGSTTSNGSIIFNPGAVAANSSVVVNTPRPDQPGLILNNVAGTTTANVFEIRDSSSSVVLQVIGSGDAGSPNALTLKGQVSPIGTTPTYTLGNTTHRWLKLWVQDIDISGAITGGGAGVANGFFVTGQSTVIPPSTAVGLQVYHDPSTHISYLKSYSTGSTVSGLDITAIANFNQVATFQGGISLNNAPTITNAFSGQALNIVGANTGNGNILLTPGNAGGGNNSVRVFQATTGQPAMILKGIGGATASTILEIQDGSATTARFWVEAGGNSTTGTGCPNCVHTATIFPAADGSFDVGADTLKYRLMKAYGIQLGQIPTDIPSGATAQIVQNGLSLFVIDGLSSGIASVVGRVANGTYASPSAITSGNQLFSISGRGWNGSAYTTTGSAAVIVIANENWTPSAQGGDVLFQTTSPGTPASSRTSRMTISSAGLIPAADSTYQLGNGSFRWASANIVNLTVGSCLGCGPADMMTTDTGQTVTGTKVFTQAVTSNIGFASTNSASNTLNIPNGGILAFNGTYGSFPNYVIIQNTAPQINASALGTSFNFNGSTSGNGNIVFNPGAVFGNASVVINTPTNSQPGLIVKNVSGSTSGNVFQIQDGVGNITFQVIAAGDSGSPNALTLRGEVSPIGTTPTFQVGNTTHRWLKMWMQDLDQSGSATINIGSGNFFNRTFAGTPSCSGVGNGWMGIDTTSTGRLWVCIGGVARSVALF